MRTKILTWRIQHVRIIPFNIFAHLLQTHSQKFAVQDLFDHVLECCMGFSEITVPDCLPIANIWTTFCIRQPLEEAGPRCW